MDFSHKFSFVVRALIVFVLASALATIASAQKVRLRAQITPNCTVVSGSSGSKFADIYADGNIAVQGSYNCRGVFIYDISDPDRPVLASVYDPSPRQAFLEAIVIGNRGYFGSGGPFPAGAPSTGDGVHIVDLTNPYQPVLIGKVNESIGGGFNGIHEMVVHGNYLIENYNATSRKSLRFIDISNPQAPFLRWEMSPTDSVWVHAVHVRGNRMYTSGWGGQIEIYDISNLAVQAPTRIGTIFGNSTNHSSWTSEDGNYLYSCRETLDGDLRVYDVRDPAAPLLVRSINTTQLGVNAISPHNPVVKGNYLYISWYQAGVQVFDITDRTSPRRVGQYDTFQQTFAPPAEAMERLENPEPWDLMCGASNRQNALPTTFQGNWAVFPDLGHDRVLAGDLANGLLVLDATGVSEPLDNNVSDFDGDGRTDLSVFTPATGNWQIEMSTGGAVAHNFGLNGDVLTSGDYNGDGVVELSIYRPSTGTWWFRQPNGTFTAVTWGLAGDVPVPADYDADGRTDIAVWRPSTGIWYILRSSLGLWIVNWGISTDKPVAGDFEGDGKADVAVWRPSNGVWYILQSSSSIPMYVGWGLNGDKPLSADFDGNGRTDFAVFRPSNGLWYVHDPSANPATRGYAWGLADDVPVPADFDGDSMSDVAVFRPSTNQWFWVNSSDGSVVVRVFGQSGDVPSPSSVQPH